MRVLAGILILSLVPYSMVNMALQQPARTISNPYKTVNVSTENRKKGILDNNNRNSNTTTTEQTIITSTIRGEDDTRRCGFGNDNNCSFHLPVNGLVLPIKERQNKTWHDYPEGRAFLKMKRFIGHLTNIPGIIANPLCILTVMSSKPLQTPELYILVRGLSDLCTVVFRYSMYLSEGYLSNPEGVLCKLLRLSASVSSLFSSYILVLWTLERLIVVFFPFYHSYVCSKENSKMAVIVTFVVSFAIALAFVEERLNSVLAGDNLLYCCQYTSFIYKSWLNAESVFYIYLPLLIIFTFNINILLQKINDVTMAYDNQLTFDEIRILELEQCHVTNLHLTVSSTYFVLHSPYILSLMWGYLYPDVNTIFYNSPHDFSKYVLFTSIGLWVIELQHSINFFLYCTVLCNFRVKFTKLLCQFICCHLLYQSIL